MVFRFVILNYSSGWQWNNVGNGDRLVKLPVIANESVIPLWICKGAESLSAEQFCSFILPLFAGFIVFR